ncbi:hypothetical protein MY11210_004838 [Beauveria gryllotalpidicola]
MVIPPAPAPAQEIELRPLPGPANNSDGAIPAPTETRHGNLELSRRDTPKAPADAATVVPTIWEPYLNRFRLAADAPPGSFRSSSRRATAPPASVGYVTAGFWGGITLGRFLLVAPAQRIGEKRYVYGLVVGALVFELLVWLVPDVVGNAVAVSIVSASCLAPCTRAPCPPFLRGMSHKETLSGMGTIRAFGSMGGAVWPFIVGLLAQAVDTWVLHPIEKRRSE